MIEVNVNGIFLTQSQASGIILKEKNGERTLPIVIGEYEAQSIALGLENIKPPRPITHDLTLSILESCGVTMDSVLITELKNNTYYAVIRLKKKLKYWDVDARPSDAIAMAVRSTIPIFVDEDVMNVGSYEPDEEEKETKNYAFESVTSQLDQLKSEVQKAVESEDYERAADLRDQIKKIESGS
ncbi:MAG: bifunctional nuclease family protein [Calditrichia bacterium]|nr:bifunctional nuclease family protein [Calditrichia bacterium]